MRFHDSRPRRMLPWFVMSAAMIGVSVAAAPIPNAGCSPNVVPVGQANPPGSQLEPLAPIWCFTPLAAPNPPTRVSGINDWSDNFDGVAQMGRFVDGDYDYRVFDHVQNGSAFAAMHFTNNQHWMDDNAGGFAGGTMIRPNRSFSFEQGELVVEEDVAAGITGYDGTAWPEIDITTASAPTGVVVDSLYGYGQFGGNWTIGCRLHAQRNPICSVENAASNVTNTNNAPPCFRSAPARVIEMSDFEVCGSIHTGGNTFNGGSDMWRACSSAANEPDMVCRDRFRMEITESSLTLYVNGQLYFQDANWPASSHIDPSVIANSKWYVYATDWEDRPSAPAYRYHWDNFVVNPHNFDGTFRAPSAAPNYCKGQPNNTCMTGMTPGPTATNTPVASTSTPVPATATPATSSCTIIASLNGTPTVFTRPLAYCTNQ